MNIRIPVLFILLVLLSINGCSRESTPPKSNTPPTNAMTIQEGIQWYDGSLDSAFALAKEQGKPLFVYWGAEWCPYCKALQATIFIRDEFIGLSRQFIAVDMSNGDSEVIRSADQYKIYGLPTVIVFGPDGQEITRIAGGTNMDQYAAVLELTLNSIRPVAQLVASARAGGKLSADDWYLLSTYSWIQDRGQALGDEAASEVLLDVYGACPAGQQKLACSKLGMSSLAVWLLTPEEEREEHGAQHLEMVNAILADPTLAQTNLHFLAGFGADIVKLAGTDEQAPLQAELMSLYAAAIDNPATGLLEKTSLLSGWAEVVSALLLEGESVTAEDAAWARERADTALAQLNSYQLHAGVNNLWGVYYDVGLESRARETLQYGIENSKARYYFMSGMAYVEQEAGNTEASLDWRRQAWEATQRPLDQIKWGGGYLQRLVSLAPENTAEIQRVAAAVIGEIMGLDDGVELYAESLGKYQSALEEWSAADPSRQAVITALRQQVDGACAASPQGEAAQAFCGSFLRQAEAVDANQAAVT